MRRTIRGAHSAVGLLATITGTAPSAWTWSLCEADRVVDGYQPFLSDQGDPISDNGDDAETSITILQRGPHRLGGTLTATYQRASDVLAAVDVKGATVVLDLKFRSAGGETETTRQLKGTVVDVEHESAATVTLQIELRAELAEADIPKTVVRKASGFTDERIPAESIDEPIPILLGRFARHLGPNLSAENAQAWRRNFFPFRPVVTPGIEVQRASATESYYAFADYAGDLKLGNPADTAAVGAQAAFLYNSEVDEYAQFWPEGTNVVFGGYAAPYINKCWIASVQQRPWCFLPVRPRVIGTVSGAIDPEKMIDGETFTYGKIGPGSSVYFNLPTFAAPGILSQNSTVAGTGPKDYEGGNAPPGFALLVVLCAPPSETRLACSLAVDLVFPRTNDRVFGHSAFTAAAPTTAGTGSLAILALPFCNQSTGAVGGATDGWGGTKIHQCDFTSAPENDSGSPDFPLYNSSGSNPGRVEPLRVRLSHASGSGTAYVAGVWLGVGFRANTAANTPTRHLRTSGGYNLVTGQGSRQKRYYIDHEDSTRNPRGSRVGRRVAWDRGPAVSYGAALKRPASLNVYFSSGGYADDGNFGLAAGTIFASPVDQLRYLLAGKYGLAESLSTVLGGFGSFETARNNLNAWATQAGAASWVQDNPYLGEGDVNDYLAQFQASVPPLWVKRQRSGAWGVHCWFPSPAKFSNDYYAGSAAVTIDARQQVLSGNDGPDLELGRTSRIVNDLTIRYGWDPGRGAFRYTAVCNASKSSDGQGGTWAPLPGGADPIALCAWSQGSLAAKRYGVRRDSIDLHGVQDGKVAVAVGLYMLSRYYRQRPTLRGMLGPEFCDLEAGHIVSFEIGSLDACGFPSPFGGGSTWADDYWIVRRSEGRRPGGGGVAQWIELELMPSAVGGEIAGLSGTQGGTGDDAT